MQRVGFDQKKLYQNKPRSWGELGFHRSPKWLNLSGEKHMMVAIIDLGWDPKKRQCGNWVFHLTLRNLGCQGTTNEAQQMHGSYKTGFPMVRF